MVGCMGMKTPDYRKNMITAMDLHETGKALMYQKIVRENPGASAEAIDEMWRDWLFRRKDVIPGDVSGPVRIRRAS